MEAGTALPRVYVLAGPTASGKAGAACEIARRLPVDIVSMDSMKVYRTMDIGTAKPPAAWREAVPYHCLDLVWPWEDFDLRRWLDAADQAVARIIDTGRIPLLVGGTGLYLRGFVYGVFEGPPARPAVRARLRALAAERGTAHLHDLLRAGDPEAAARIHPNDLLRLVRALEVLESTGEPLSSQQQQATPRPGRTVIMAGLRRAPDDMDRRIDARVDRMMEAGFLEEVRRLQAGPRPPGRSAAKALGYGQLARHLAGCCSLEEAVAETKKLTRRFARKQLTWLRSFPHLRWTDAAPGEDGPALADRVLKAYGLAGGKNPV